MWTCALAYVILCTLDIATCNPRKKIWNPLMTTGHCINSNAVHMSSGVFNCISDFVILILPMFPISKLQLPQKKKLKLMAIFATGIL